VVRRAALQVTEEDDVSAMVLERRPAANAPADGRTSGRSVRVIPVLLMIGGGVLVLAAASLAIPSLRSYRDGDRPVATAVVRAHAFPEVGVSQNTYQPGHTSGWHIHSGVHSVVVLAGTLTIYDAMCHRTDYHPGDAYLGGREPHIARNETTEPVELVVTYVYADPSRLHHAALVPAPAGCDAQ
jgi:quercetin dioxygenase-like cupin family protein